VFIGVNIQQVLQVIYGVDLNKETAIAIIVPLVIVATWIRNLDELASFSTIANVCIAFSLLVILYDECEKFITNDITKAAAVRQDDGIQLAAYKSLPIFFGSVTFAFEGIGVVLPLENKMRHPENAVLVVALGMTIVVLLYAIFGVLGYLAFGGEIEASITLNLKSNTDVEKIFFYLAKLYYAYAIFASYLVQFYVPMNFLEVPLFSRLRLQTLEYKFPRHGHRVFPLFQTVFRLVVVIITAAIAIGLPDLGDMISLVGAFACGALAFVIPPTLELLTRLPQRHSSKWWVVWCVKDVAIITLGVLGFVFGTYATVVNIVKYFKNS
jgi:proton-coupled amino acid transporter